MHRTVAETLLIAALLAVAPGAVRAQTSQWYPIGPAPINGMFSGGVSGRASVIAVNPDNGQQVWLGTAAGGVWFSANGGQTWKPLSDKVESLAVGAIQLADCDVDGCATVYVGTGENAIRRDTYYGAGLLVGTRVTSDPLVYSWLLRDGTPSFDFHGGSIVDIAVHPGTSGTSTILWIALSSGVTMSSSQATIVAPEPVGGYGLYKSTDQGASWTKLTVNASAGALPTSLRIDPQATGTLYAGFLGRGVFRSTNGGASWCPLNPGIDEGLTCAVGSGLPDPTLVTFDHVEVVPTLNSFAPGSPTYLYATFGFCPNWQFKDCEPSMYKSIDGGATWQQRRVGSTAKSTVYPPPCGFAYSRYTHGLAVHPQDHNIVYLSGVSLCHSAASGGVAVTAHTNAVPGSGPWDWGNLIHLDHHTVVFDPSDPTHRYSTSDGGFAEQTATTGPFAWTPRNERLQITGFQTIASSALTEVVLGASQDNGGQLWSGGLAWDWLPCCGDGGYVVLDADDPKIMYATQNFGSMGISRDGGITWTDPRFTVAPADPWNAFYTPLIQGPGSHALFYGGSRLWRSPDKSATWTQVSPVLSHSVQPDIYPGFDVISAIAVAPGDENRIYVGYYGGGIWTTSNPTADCDDLEPPNPVCALPTDWTPANVGLPSAPVTGIAVSALDPLHAWISLSGFGSYARVWETTDAGQSWVAIDLGLPSGVPANTIAVDHDAADTLLVGLDGNASGASLWRRPSGTSTWVDHSNGLPNAPVMSLSVDATRQRTYVATHGRGAFMRGPAFVLTFEPWVEELISAIPIFGWQFEPGVDCSVQLLEPDGTQCVDSSVDALGGTLRTDADGRLTSSLAGMFDETPLVWACIAGVCAGGVDLASCGTIDQVQVSCGSDTVSHVLHGVQVEVDPASALLRSAALDGGAAAGLGATAPLTFDLVASLHSGDGATRSLCSVAVEIADTDLPSDVLATAAAALAASPVCVAEGVQVALHGGEPTFEEDGFGAGPWLQLQTPTLTGTQLLPAIHAAPGSAPGRCFELRALGLPVRSQLHMLSLQFETAGSGAAGGEVTLVETTGLGTCAITVTTEAGQTGDEIAALVAQAFQEPGIPGPQPHCPSRRNPRDVIATDDRVQTILASTLEVCVTDPGVGIFLKSQDLANVHPVAVCSAATTECSGPAGATVTLDGSGSRDPNSTPGTNDDLVAYRWFLDYGMASQQLLGTGVQLDADLALGSHAVTLVVEDAAGLSGAQTCTMAVVDTVSPSLSATLDPILLWPPNHRLVDVVADVQASDLCGVPTVELVLLVSDEPDDAAGPDDGSTSGDIDAAAIGTDDRAYRLRAERDRSAEGRRYTVETRAVDGAGNMTLVQSFADVPLDVGGIVEPILLDALETAAGTLLNWTPVAGAPSYNVIAGELALITDSGNAYDLGPVVCIEAGSGDATTLGDEDARVPLSGQVFFYVVEFVDGGGPGSGYGTESAAKPRGVAAGACP